MIEELFDYLSTENGDFSTVWNVIDVNDGIIISHTPYAVTAIAAFPACYMKDRDEWALQMNKLIQQFTSAPHGTILNSYLLKYFEQPSLQAKTPPSETMLRFLEEKRLEKINSMPTPFYHSYVSITIPVELTETQVNNPFRKWLSEFILKAKMKKKSFKRSSLWAMNETISSSNNIKAFSHSIQTLKNLMEQLSFKFDKGCRVLNSEGVYEFLSILYNHNGSRPVSSMQSIMSSDVVTDSKEGLVYYNGMWHATISARSKDLPKLIKEDFTYLYYDEAVKQIPFTIQCGVRFPSPDKASTEAQRLIGLMSAAEGPTWLPSGMQRKILAIRDQMQAAVDATHQYAGRIVDMNYTICSWAKDKDTLEKNIMTLRNALRGREMGTSRDTYNLKPAYFGLTPWLSHINKIETRLTSMNAEMFMPLLYPPIYPNQIPPKKPIYLHTKFDQVMSFDSQDRVATCYNGIITGTSGTGKSFAGNYLILNKRQYGGKIFIIDKGGQNAGSYRNLVKNLNGSYIQINFSGNSNFSINPFDGALFVDEMNVGTNEDGINIYKTVPSINGRVDADKVVYLIGVIETITCKEDESLTKEEEYFFQLILEQAYKAYNNNENNSLTLTRFANEYLLGLQKENQFFLGTLNPDDCKEWGINFYNKMQKFINSGMYSSFFAETKSDLSQDVYCFDLDGLEKHKDLAPIMTAMVLEKCYRLIMDGNSGIEKLVFIDEAWSLLSGGKLMRAIENIWRTIRKHSGAIYVATQSFGSILESPIAGALMDNTAFYFLMGSKYDIDILSKISAPGKYGENSISMYNYEGIKSQNFNPPHFSEGFLLTPVYAGTFRLRPSSYDYWLSTTDGNDKQKLQEIMQKHGVDYVTPEVLNEAVNG